MVSGIALLALFAGCAQGATTRATRRDKTLKGAGIRALSGAALSVALGNRKADKILTGASATLMWPSRTNLGKVAEVINEYKKIVVVIQGHTDSTGTEAHNQELSERRAGAVKSFFIVHGVNQDRLAATGFGEGEPLASNETNDGRRQNRRVNILL